MRPVPPSEADAAPADPKMSKGVGKPATEVAAARPAGTPVDPDTSAKTTAPVPSGDPAKLVKPMPTEVAAVTPMNTPPVVEKIIAAVPLRLPLAAEVIAKQQAAWSRNLKQPVTQLNSLRMPFVLIPPGEFEMGATPAAGNEAAPTHEPGDKESLSIQDKASAYPRHHVKIGRPFAVGQHEVTVGQFRQFVTATGYKTIAERETATGASLSEGVNQKKRMRQPIYSWQFAGELVLEEEHPVTNLSWYDAVAYCEWLSQKEGVIYRLPTEAEWEYVARAGLGTMVEGSVEWLEWTKQAANLADVTGLNTFGQTGLVTKSVDWDDTFAAQAPIGRFSPNVLGLQDLSGNVSEWCSDRYDPEYYKMSPLENPRGPNTGASRVVRGASWQSTAEECRVETRSFAAPNQAQLHVGFRLVQELPALADADAPKAPLSVAQRDLAIAEWVLNLGGKVRVAINRAPSNEITKVADLPKAVAGTEFTVYSVNLAETGISDLGLARLKPLSGLQELNLSANPITDAGLEMLASFRLLQKLILNQTEVSGTGLIHLSASKKLTELDLSYCPVTDASISTVKGLTTLTVMRLNSTSITDSALEQFKPLSALKELSLIDTRITGSGLSFLRNLAALTTLDLSETPLDNKQLKSLADLKSLRQVRFNWSTINDIGLTHLNESFALTELGLRGTDVNDFDIDTLQRLKAIRKLDLRDTDFTATGVETLEKALKTKITASFGDVNARVASLCLSVGGKVVIAADRNAEPQAVTQLSGLPTSRFEIREIHLSNLPVRDGVLWMVPKLSGLRVLKLDGTNIDDAGVAAIVQAPKLQSLNLEGTRITEQALSEILTSKTLKTLSLRNNRISEDKLTELRAKLSGVEIQ
jgi:sulfatase modifying factor 1